MTKREAKRYVCRVIACEIEDHLQNGSCWIYNDAQVDGPDIPRVEAAIMELADELARRGGR